MNRSLATFLVLIGVGALSGCGEGGAVATISGAITYNGEPVENGAIAFTPAGAESAFSASIVGGRYEAKEARAGQYKVTIQASAPTAAAGSREAYDQQGQSAGPASQPASYIPADAQGNGETIDVQAGDQVRDFALTGSARK